MVLAVAVSLTQLSYNCSYDMLIILRLPFSIIIYNNNSQCRRVMLKDFFTSTVIIPLLLGMLVEIITCIISA